MKPSIVRLCALLCTVLPAACAAPAPDAAPPTHAHADSSMGGPITIPKGAIYTAADVHFMQGMIAHHAQAIHMSRLAAKQGANPRILRFALKIDQSQIAEITLMQDWLYRNEQFAPDTSSHRTMSMPGMLTAAQLAQLDSARGPAFDRHFLVLMIQHHEGALKMVKDLRATRGALQDVDVAAFANDVDVVQTAEIDAMNQMLFDLKGA